MVRWRKGWWTAVLLVATIASIGCIEESLVVKVKRDGSGVIHVRSYQQKTKLFSFGSADSSDDQEDEHVAPPSNARLNRVAESLGPGVRVQQAVSKTNAQGWKGYEVVFAFDDVNQLVLNSDLLDLDDEEEDEDNRESDDDGKNEADKWLANTRFRLQNDRLVILQQARRSQPAEDAADTEPPATTDPFAEAPKSGPIGPIGSEAIRQTMSAALKEARVGVFVELEGGIGETNARHHTARQITLLKAELGPLLNQPQALERMKRIEGLPGDQFRGEMQVLADETEGLDIDTKPEIAVRFASQAPAEE